MFFPGAQSVYVNATRCRTSTTTSTVPSGDANRFQVRYNNIPGQDKPLQPLQVTYTGAYLQDEWTVSDKFKDRRHPHGRADLRRNRLP